MAYNATAFASSASSYFYEKGDPFVSHVHYEAEVGADVMVALGWKWINNVRRTCTSVEVPKIRPLLDLSVHHTGSSRIVRIEVPSRSLAVIDTLC